MLDWFKFMDVHNPCGVTMLGPVSYCETILLVLKDFCSVVPCCPHRQVWCEQFQSLKAELLSCRTVETAAGLMLELTTACQRYFSIRSLFWMVRCVYVCVCVCG